MLFFFKQLGSGDTKNYIQMGNNFSLKTIVHVTFIFVSIFIVSGCRENSRKKYPTVNEIKNELIGRRTENWRFDYLSEFLEIEILNWTIGENRLEGDLKMKLLDRGENKIYLMEAIAVYKWKRRNWILSDIGEISHEIIVENKN